MRNKKWVRLLAYVTGSVNQEVLGKAAAGQHPPLEPRAENVWRTLDAKSQAMVVETEQPVKPR